MLPLGSSTTSRVAATDSTPARRSASATAASLTGGLGSVNGQAEFRLGDQLYSFKGFKGVMDQVVQAFLHIRPRQRADVLYAAFVHVLGGEAFTCRRDVLAKQVIGRAAHH
jgi:hypothetical protein